jgi:hypothetical protein
MTANRVPARIVSRVRARGTPTVAARGGGQSKAMTSLAARKSMNLARVPKRSPRPVVPGLRTAGRPLGEAA